MSEPEGLLAEGAWRATVAVRDLWWRVRPAATRGDVPLARVKQRIELVVTALYGDAPAITPSDPPPAPTWLARALGRAPDHLRVRAALAATDGVRLWLPRVIAGDEASALATYRLLAVEQAARIARGTPALVPAAPLERDLYLLAEAVAVDRRLARDFPGLAGDLADARRRALVGRPPLAALRPVERAVETMIQAVLSADPAAPAPVVPLSASPAEPRTVPLCATPADSLAWAAATAAALGPGARGYRGVAAVFVWGGVIAAPAVPSAGHVAPEPPAPAKRAPKRAALRQRPRVRPAGDDEDDAQPGTWMIRPDEPMESAEDPMGLQRPADHDDEAKAADLADALSELPEARVVRTPGSPREVLDGDGDVARASPAPARDYAAEGGIVYPEWDWREGAYRPRGAIVRVRPLAPGPDAWVDDVMRRHRALVGRVRRRFDALRPRRVRVGRQADGTEIDLPAYVTALADWRAGQSGDDRLYIAARPTRRDLALALLVDTSASTDSWIAGSLRVIDVEKEALVVLLEALDALGDRHAVLTFQGEGPWDVRLAMVKDFDERGGAEVRRRVASLEPDGYTRAGAAIRHASALLSGQAARHRLLLILTDGKPNDVDEYAGRYGVADTHQAVSEARLQGLVPFCLTVDRAAPSYMPSIFGPTGYAVLPRQELLPAVLVDVVRRLVAS